MEPFVKHTEQLNNIDVSSDSSKQFHCNGTKNDSDTIYYGVHIPSDIQIQDADGYSNVYQDKLEALKLVKKYKKARFKAFHFYHEAAEFAIHGAEYPNNNTTLSKCDGSIISKDYVQTNTGEKAPPFRGPKSQDLVKLRKYIEAGSLDVVQTTIWENPRYLISSGDTPSILQEGSRYNALHIAAKAKSREMCELILNTISNTSFIKLLYGDDDHQDADERASMLLDLYLNTPDKGLNETPLHFAVKFGALEVVELLVSFPQCDKTVVNKFGKSPNMIICDRCESSSVIIKNKIAVLLEDTYYVPVYRSEDNCVPPVIGEPFAPSSPPNFNTNVLNPRMEIHAYAGPMNKEGADSFRRVWKTPPRSLKLESPSSKTNKVSSIDPTILKYKDLDKGLERLGRNLAAKFDVGWKEYWTFLGNFVDFSTTEGLKMLDNYLAERFNAENSCSSSPKYTSSSESDLITSSPKIRSKDNVQTNAISPISDLCKDLEACTLSDTDTKKYNCLKSNLYTSCSAFNENNQEIMTETQLFKPDLSPFLCIEKSCQVFAHRISNEILNSLESEYGNATVMLEIHIKQLELLMASFMNDSRFITVDFHLVHYRLACLISNKLKSILRLEIDYNFIKNTFEQWLESCHKQFDYFSSDDESCSYRQTSMCKKSTSKNKQVICLLECILSTLVLESQTDNQNINSEEECIQIWGEAKPCACNWQTNTSRRGSLVKKSNSFKYTSRSLAASFNTDNDSVHRQLFSPLDEHASDNTEKHCDIFDSKLVMDESQISKNNFLDIVNEKYYTPPNSPSFLNDSSDEDTFEDSFLPEHDVFIEGCVPTRTDYAVYNAVKCAADRLNPHDYPYVYKWNHSVSLYSENEQQSWQSPSTSKYTLGSFSATSTPPRANRSITNFSLSQSNLYTSPNSWLRITGANSPRSSLKPYARGNLSFN